MAHKTTLLSTGFVTHDVKRYLIAKPTKYNFTPGQWTMVSLDQAGLKDDKRPFTFTCRPDDGLLEFTIKSYHDHNGVTHALWDAKPGTILHIDDPIGEMKYKKSGLFIAAGVGITPFLSMVRDLWSKGELHNSSLLYTNKTKADIISEHELTHYFSRPTNGLLFTLTRKSSIGYISGRITKNILKEFSHNDTHNAYICGPEAFVKDMSAHVAELGIPKAAIVFTK